jgi:hypothetical protein
MELDENNRVIPIDHKIRREAEPERVDGIADRLEKLRVQRQERLAGARPIAAADRKCGANR